MPCYLLRAKRLASSLDVPLPQDPGFEDELRKETRSADHDELTKKLWVMSDDEFVRLVKKILKRRRGWGITHVEGQEALAYA